MKQIPASLLTLTAGIIVTLFSLWIGQNHHLLPAQASEQAPLVDDLFDVMVTIGMALFLVVEGAIVIFMIKFRQRPGDNTDGEPIEGNFSLEIFWTAIPALIVIGLGVYSVEVYQQMGGCSPSGSMIAAHQHGHSAHTTAHKMAGSAIAAPLLADTGNTETTSTDTASTNKKLPKYGVGATPGELNKPAELTVNVLGMQYAWIFTYPETGITSGELHVPIGKDVQLNLNAQDVIHSFWVPQFRLKQDAIPGQNTDLRFITTKLGTYPVVCTELCGAYHGSMRTQVIVQTPEEFEAWMKESQVAQQQDLTKALAVKPSDLPGSEFLAPYAHEMGVKAEMLNQLHVDHHS